MPPKVPQKAKLESKKATTTEDASPLHLNLSPIEPQVLQNDIGDATQRLDNLIAKCRVGVAWVDLLKIGDNLLFGEYNDRLENEAETNKLIASFKAAGIAPMKEASAIPIVLDIKWIKPGMILAHDFIEPDNIPELELIDAKKIVVASGQH
ncbi:hypothetical protein EDB19DRAFT_1833590 [Suillus lakei]|nr:hypothetical protein EDB19DRAFT_1833590 [Suillus lakei]